jgi:hypothetical protein
VVSHGPGQAGRLWCRTAALIARGVGVASGVGLGGVELGDAVDAAVGVVGPGGGILGTCDPGQEPGQRLPSGGTAPGSGTFLEVGGEVAWGLSSARSANGFAQSRRTARVGTGLNNGHCAGK